MLLIYGSFVQDQVWRVNQFPAVGQTCVGQFATGPGGKGFNQAIAGQRAGAAVQFLGALGDDLLGTGARAFAAQEKLDAHWFITQEATATAGILVDPEGRNLIAVALAANLALSVAQLQQAADRFLACKVFLTQLECDRDCTLAALQWAKHAGASTILNPAPAPEFLLDRPWQACIDVLTPNETEFCALLRQAGGPVLGAHFVHESEAQLHAWCQALGVPTVIMTLGALGAFVSHREPRLGDSAQYYRVPAERVNPIDTTGAGDAFNGALAASMWLDPDQPLGTHVRFASQFAGLSTEQPGAARAMPTRAQWQARFGG